MRRKGLEKHDAAETIRETLPLETAPSAETETIDPQIEAGREYKFSYRLIWLNDVIKGEDIAYVSATRTGQGGISGSEDVSETRKFVIDFIGKNLDPDFSQKGITPNVSAISGKIINVSAIYNPITKGITVYADYAPHSDNDEIRISLEQNGKTISEVWSYQWLK